MVDYQVVCWWLVGRFVFGRLVGRLMVVGWLSCLWLVGSFVVGWQLDGWWLICRLVIGGWLAGW